MNFKLPCIPAIYFKHIAGQYVSHRFAEAPSYNVCFALLAEAFQQAQYDKARGETETSNIECYNDWLEYLSLVADIYGKAAVTRTIMSISMFDKLAKRLILHDIDMRVRTKNVRNFGRYVLIALYGYHAHVINNMLEYVTNDATTENEIDCEQLYDELLIIINTCKPEGFDDVLWEQYVWSYA